jgi:poly [ADP-ribose] polymerase
LQPTNQPAQVIQLLEADGGGQFYVWTRWGRVGTNGQNKLEKSSSLDGAALAVRTACDMVV